MEQSNEFLMKPKNDFCFKELMADETVRKGFLAAVLQLEPESIKGSVITSPILEKKHDDEKLGILDVRVELTDGTQIDIEIQIASQKYWIQRTVYYLSRMYSLQLKKGEDYTQLKKCIHIGILNFVLYQDEEEFYSEFHLMEDKRHFLYSDHLEFHVLELPKLKRYTYPKTALLEWANFLNAEKKEEMEKVAEENKYIKEAYQRLHVISADKEKRLEYEAREKAIRDYNSGLNAAYEDGVAAGHAEGCIFGSRKSEMEFSKLVALLLKEGKMEELYRISQDMDYYHELCEKYKIEEQEE